MKDEDNIKDWRSTGRRKARRTLYNAFITYECFDCGVTPIVPPKDAPAWFEEIWPVVAKVKERKTISSQLQADHETKNVRDNEIGLLAWRCPSCHKKHDMLTEKGESTQAPIVIY